MPSQNPSFFYLKAAFFRKRASGRQGRQGHNGRQGYRCENILHVPSTSN